MFKELLITKDKEIIVTLTDVYFSLIFSGAATGQRLLYLVVRTGDEVTLSCNSVIDDQNNCDRTEWIYDGSRRRPVELVRDGQIGEEAKDKSDRLSVTENCSLVIKKVREEDDGRYTCRRIRSGEQYILVYLSVVTSEYLHHHVFKLSR